ncbi:MAG: prepilin-type N-terminal cleavage/methylation domain-containing protein [Dorea sp.]|jgi:type IV pilus assembly protein PilA|nr:prepilin-type N-terminal cleavage/methylation domain-containing protein [Dorea sp.]
MKRKLKENKKKGFTLVELIVVLVILAILAALLIPALTGYIDKAKKKQIVAETRSCVMAAQTYAEEQYAMDKTGMEGTDKVMVDGTETEFSRAIEALAEVDTNAVTAVKVTGGKVESLKYVKDGLTCEYKADWAGTKTSDGKYNITK